MKPAAHQLFTFGFVTVLLNFPSLDLAEQVKALVEPLTIHAGNVPAKSGPPTYLRAPFRRVSAEFLAPDRRFMPYYYLEIQKASPSGSVFTQKRVPVQRLYDGVDPTRSSAVAPNLQKLPPSDHVFWQVLAGMLDGDGSLDVQPFRKKATKVSSTIFSEKMAFSQLTKKEPLRFKGLRLRISGGSRDWPMFLQLREYLDGYGSIH
jgi:hypothetical protein